MSVGRTRNSVAIVADDGADLREQAVDQDDRGKQRHEGEETVERDTRRDEPDIVEPRLLPGSADHLLPARREEYATAILPDAPSDRGAWNVLLLLPCVSKPGRAEERSRTEPATVTTPLAFRRKQADGGPFLIGRPSASSSNSRARETDEGESHGRRINQRHPSNRAGGTRRRGKDQPCRSDVVRSRRKRPIGVDSQRLQHRRFEP